MKKIIKKSIFVFCLLFLILPLTIKADGMILPHPNYYIHETDQKAVIFYDKGVETLILSITFKGNADDFGWVVPVPSKPEVSKGSDDVFTNLEKLTGYTSRYYDEMPVFGLGGKETTQKVTIIETKKIDYYDVTVLSSTDREALTEWLQDNNYNFPSSASYILESYITNNWYFVAMKINPQSLGWKDVSQQLREGHAIPVVLKFKTNNIVYPLKISSVVSRDSGVPEVTIPLTDETFSGPNYSTGFFGQGIVIDQRKILSFPAGTSFSTKEGTIELWFTPDNTWKDGTNGFFDFFSIVDSDTNHSNRDVLEIRRDKNSINETLQFFAYDSNGKPQIWQTKSNLKYDWHSGDWYNLAVTWSADQHPTFYINGILHETESASGYSTWTIRDDEGTTLYFGQLGDMFGSYPLYGTLDEARISSKRKTPEEIYASYDTQVLDKKPFSVEENTLFLAHFNSNLKEEKSGKTLDYEDRGETNHTTISEVTTGFKPNLTVTYIDENKITHTDTIVPVADATIATNYNNNYGKTGFCSVGKNTHACLLKFNLSTISSKATISKVSLSLYQYDGFGDLDIQIYRLLKDWKEGKGTSSSGNQNGFDIDGVTARERFYGAPWSKEFIGTDDTDASSQVYSTLTVGSKTGTYTWQIDNDLIEGWVKGDFPNYGMVIKASSSGSPHALYSKDYTGTGSEIKRNVTYSYPTSASILLYIIADHKKELTNFGTQYANWIDKNNIKKLAVDDQGSPLINPSSKKYFLTKLTRTMSYTDMTADLFPQDADNNQTIGEPIKSGGTESITTFYLFIGVAVAVTIFLIIIIFINTQERSKDDKNKLIINK